MKKIIITIYLLIPNFVFAARTIEAVSKKVATFFGKTLMVLIFSAALAMFLWGIVEFIRNAENSEEREKGKKHILWGIIALFAMVTFLSLTGIITNTFFGGNPVLPQLYE